MLKEEIIQKDEEEEDEEEDKEKDEYKEEEGMRKKRTRKRIGAPVQGISDVERKNNSSRG